MVEALRTDYSMRQICEVLGFHRSNLYYAPKSDPSEEVLRAEIEKLALRYPTYGYRRITQLLQRQGRTVGYKRVARLMKLISRRVGILIDKHLLEWKNLSTHGGMCMMVRIIGR